MKTGICPMFQYLIMTHYDFKNKSLRIKHLGKWKFSTPLQILHVVRHSGGMHKNALFIGCSILVAMVTMAACSRPRASFSFKNVAKRVKCLFLCLKLNTTLLIGTSTIHSNIIRPHFDIFNFPWEWMWTHQEIIYLSTASVIFFVG